MSAPLFRKQLAFTPTLECKFESIKSGLAVYLLTVIHNIYLKFLLEGRKDDLK